MSQHHTLSPGVMTQRGWLFRAPPVVREEIRHLKVVQQVPHGAGILAMGSGSWGLGVPHFNAHTHAGEPCPYGGALLFPLPSKPKTILANPIPFIQIASWPYQKAGSRVAFVGQVEKNKDSKVGNLQARFRMISDF